MGPSIPLLKENFEVGEQTGMRRLDFKAPASQAYVGMAFKVPKLEAADLMDAADGAAPSPTAAASRDALALTVLAAVLDGYSGARLERALVQGEGRLADSAGASTGQPNTDRVSPTFYSPSACARASPAPGPA